MKHPFLLFLLLLPLCVLAGCIAAPPGGTNETQKETEPTGASAVPSDAAGLSCDWFSGSMAGESRHYSVIKDETGRYLFCAEAEPERRTVKREITQAEFDGIMQTAFELSRQTAQTNPESTNGEPAALDADRFSFAYLDADGQPQPADFGRAGNSLLRQFVTLLEESPDE